MKYYSRDTLVVREFIGKTIMRLFVMIAVMVMVFMITQTPVFTNDIAMDQMENSNDWFVAMTMYQKFANVAELFGKVNIAVTLGFIGWDGYKLAKTLKSETTTDTKNEKEN